MRHFQSTRYGQRLLALVAALAIVVAASPSGGANAPAPHGKQVIHQKVIHNQYGQKAVARNSWDHVAPARSSRGHLVPSRGVLGQDLFPAVTRGELARVQTLLKQGADPDSRNTLEMTPLFLAAGSGQTKVMEALLAAGAKLDAETPFGSPLTSACVTGAVPAIDFLLSHGSRVDIIRPDGITLLMLVSRADLPDIASALLRRKADVNATDSNGASALVYAAREGQIEAGRVLLGAGAKVDAADRRGWTPLMHAAVNGHTEFVRLLLEKGADPNRRDAAGQTPLLLTAAYGDYPAVLQVLLKAGASPGALDAAKRSAATLAAARGHTESVQLLSLQSGAPAGTVVAVPLRSPNEAVAVSLIAIDHSMLVFNRMAACISCHHEGLGRTATGTAAQHGFALPADPERTMRTRITAEMEALRPLHQQSLTDAQTMKRIPLIELGDIPLYYGYVLAGMAAHRQPPTVSLGAMTMVVARQQLPDGHWMFGASRVPMESSNFTMTALAVQALRVYGPAANTKESSARLAKAGAWLLATPVQTNEDRAMRLLGLKWAGVNEAQRKQAMDELRAEQRADGGWAQLLLLQSDAYATGQALYALHEGGALPVTDPLYQRGVQFLLRTQEEDGTWFVNKRALPVNNYFDAGFAHGVSQYSSFNATCWATMALAETMPETTPETVTRSVQRSRQQAVPVASEARFKP